MGEIGWVLWLGRIEMDVLEAGEGGGCGLDGWMGGGEVVSFFLV